MKTAPTNENARQQPGVIGKAENDTQRELSFDPTPEVKAILLNAREHRLLAVLLDIPEVSRHDLDQMIGAENSPDVVLRVRRKFGLLIPMTKRPFTDRDGEKVRVGWYSLNDADRSKVASLLTAMEAA